MLRKKPIRGADSTDDLPTTRRPDPPDETGRGGGRAADDEREDPRFEARLVASLETAESAYLGFTENLSKSGAFVATKAPPNVGAEINLLIALPDLALVRARGTVRWLRPPSKAEGRAAGMGIRFERLSPLDAVRIHDFVLARRSKLLDREHRST